MSLPAFGVFCAMSVVAAILATRGFRLSPISQSEFNPIFVALQCLSMGVVFLAAHLTVFRHRRERPVPVWSVFVVSGLAGIARIIPNVLDSVRDDVPGPSVATIALSIVSIGLLTSLFAPAIAAIMATREWYTTERRRLIDLDVATEAERLRSAGALEALREVLVDSTETEVRQTAAQARMALNRSDLDPREVADELLIAARAGIRPTGHALAESAAREYPRVTVRETLGHVLYTAPLPLIVPLLAVTAVFTTRMLVIHGVREAITITLVTVGGMLLAFPPFRRVIRRYPKAALPATIGACGVATLPALAAMTLLFDGIGETGGSEENLTGWLTMSCALLVFVALTSVIRSAGDTGEAVLEEIRGPIRRAEIERIATDQARRALLRDIGLRLHGNVQSGLVAASYAIQDAIERGDGAALDEAIQRARMALDKRIDGTPQSTRTTDPVAKVAQEWNGIVDVVWDPVQPPLHSLTPAALEVIRECLANAVIHGHASHATIRVRPDERDVIIEVEDDGLGPQDGEQGFGSAVLNQHTATRWTIETGSTGGAIVRARMSVTDV